MTAASCGVCRVRVPRDSVDPDTNDTGHGRHVSGAMCAEKGKEGLAGLGDIACWYSDAPRRIAGTERHDVPSDGASGHQESDRTHQAGGEKRGGKTEVAPADGTGIRTRRTRRMAVASNTGV